MTEYAELLEQRVAWLEAKVVRLLWTMITVLSLMLGGSAFISTFGYIGGWGAFGCAVAVWVVAYLSLLRNELSGAPKHIHNIDP
jgi:hypothetical protein